jgi:hypothetical protein
MRKRPSLPTMIYKGQFPGIDIDTGQLAEPVNDPGIPGKSPFHPPRSVLPEVSFDESPQVTELPSSTKKYFDRDKSGTGRHAKPTLNINPSLRKS